MEERVETYLHSEKAESARRFIRSDGALYALLLVAVIGIIVLGNVMANLWNWPRVFTQIGLYAILLVLGYLIYRYRLVAFRYQLTDRMFTVSRLTGRKEKPEVHLHLTDIERIRPYAARKEKEGGKRLSLYHGKRADTLAVTCSEGGIRRTLLISPSKELREKLVTQWKNVRR